MDSKDLRIVYMGTPEFAVAPLKALVEGGYNVVAVITVPDKPAGRGLRICESAVKKYAVEAGLPILQPVKLKDPEFVEQFRALDADLGVVVAFRMLPEVIWSMPKLGTFNLHASLLPQYRGAAPINWAIINGETVTGVTTFFLNAKIDEGAIIDRREVAIEPDDNVGTLYEKLMQVGTGLVLESVDKIATGDYVLIKQNDVPPESLKPAPKIFRETCYIDFRKRGQDIINLIRGLSPCPAAWADLQWKDEDPIAVKVFSASFKKAEGHGRRAGEIYSDGKSFLGVVCLDGCIFLEDMQMAGKRRMTAEVFLCGIQNINNHRFV